MSILDCEDAGLGIHQQQKQPCAEDYYTDDNKKHVTGYRPSPLKISKASRKIRKASAPLPEIQYRRPIIIQTYSPKIIQTDPGNFMWLVQSLTGSSDTRSRCLKNKPEGASLPDQKGVAYKNDNRINSGSNNHGEFQKGQTNIKASITSSKIGEHESQYFQDSSSESDGLVLSQTTAIDCENPSVGASPRGPLQGGFDSLFSIPPAPAFDFSYQSYHERSCFPMADSSTTRYNPSSDFARASSQLHSAFPSLHASTLLGSASFSNGSFNSSAAWNLDGFLSPFRASRCIESLFSPCVLREPPAYWDGRCVEQLVSSSDAIVYSDFDEGRS